VTSRSRVRSEWIDLLGEFVLEELKHLGAYVHKKATSGSLYIKFRDPRIGSLRIADHKGIKIYSYRWNLYLKMPVDNPGIRKEGNVTRWYYSADDADEMCRAIERYAAAIVRQSGGYHAD